MSEERKSHDEIYLDSSWGEIYYFYIDYSPSGGDVTAPPLGEYQALLVAERMLRVAKHYLHGTDAVRLLQVWSSISRRLDQIERKLGKNPKLPF